MEQSTASKEASDARLKETDAVAEVASDAEAKKDDEASKGSFKMLLV